MMLLPKEQAFLPPGTNIDGLLKSSQFMLLLLPRTVLEVVGKE